MNKSQFKLDANKRSAEALRIQSLVKLKEHFKTCQEPQQYYDKRSFSTGNKTYYPFMFSKTLPLDFEVFPESKHVDALVLGVETGNLSQIQQDPDSDRKLENVLAGNAFSLMGDDSSIPINPNYWHVDTEEGFYEMLEVYAMAKLRDTPFFDLESLPSTDEALIALNAFSNRTYLKDFDIVGKTLLRGAFQNESNGAYISQFLYLPFNYGNIPIVQKYFGEEDFKNSIVPGVYKQIQKGDTSVGSVVQTTPKYVYNGRILGAKVHNDPLYQFYYNAALIALSNGIAPVGYANEVNSAWTSGGGPSILASVAHVALGALKVAWYHKYSVGMKIRPEQYGAILSMVDDNVSSMRTRLPDSSGATLQGFMDNASVRPFLDKLKEINQGDLVIPQFSSTSSVSGFVASQSSSDSTTAPTGVFGAPETTYYRGWRCFDRNDSTSWRPADGLYNFGSNGNYDGSQTTGSVVGEWVNIKFPSAKRLFKARIVFQRIREFYLMGKNESGEWVEINRFIDSSEPEEKRLITYTYTNETKYTDLRLVLHKGSKNRVESDHEMRVFEFSVYEYPENLYLPLQFPEGSPTHPSHPAGHACVAGACSTVLKAMLSTNEEVETGKWRAKTWSLDVKHSVDGDNLVDYPSSTSNMTINGEFNKLGSNVALGRDWAGVHTRGDGEHGMLLGEQYAISYLVDHAKEYSESYDGKFGGWVLEKFQGDFIKITKDGVEPLERYVAPPVSLNVVFETGGEI